jgi:GH15 family glucan-1,4-alpha-glucosidase
MSQPIEDYALIGDTQTVALVCRTGSIDWLCVPRFDSAACFAALLGTPDHGRWLIAPAGEVRTTRRRYRGDTLVLETEFSTDTGTVRLVDCMPVRDRHVDVVRVVEGVSGHVAMHMELVIRFDYGSIVPWVYRVDGGLRAIAGPDALSLSSPIDTRGVGLTTQAEFTVHAGDRVPFLLVWHPSHEVPHDVGDPMASLEQTTGWWEDWAKQCSYDGPCRDAVIRSLITLKALTYEPTGGLVAAATTGLPEQIGGVRNWDYRYCWLRDATLTLYALMESGYTEEATAWRNWLFRAVAGDPSKLQIMYGLGGERRLPEWTVPWLPGYEGSSPIRVGNAAVTQRQLDVYGEVMDVLRVARGADGGPEETAWGLQVKLLEFLEQAWREPDYGIWEVRGRPRHFTFSKVMAWVAFDRAISEAEQFQLKVPIDRWRETRARIHDDVCDRGFDRRAASFRQFYGGSTVDASLLLIPTVGFLPPDDPRIIGTVARVERELLRDGFVLRYAHNEHTRSIDGLPPGEGVFLACTLWLANAYLLLDRRDDAMRLFERVLQLRNDVGLLSEQYDPKTARLVGNFPQAFSHVAIVDTAHNLAHSGRPAEDRCRPRRTFRAHAGHATPRC